LIASVTPVSDTATLSVAVTEAIGTATPHQISPANVGQLTPLTALSFVELITTLAWSPDSTLLAVATTESRVLIWDVATQQQILTIAPNISVQAVAFSPDGGLLAVFPSSSDQPITLWSVKTGLQSPLLRNPLDDAVALGWSSQTSRIALADLSGAITVWNVNNGQAAQTFGLSSAGATPAPILASRIQQLVYSSDGKSLFAITSAAPPQVVRWNVASGDKATAALPQGLSGASIRALVTPTDPDHIYWLSGDTIIRANLLDGQPAAQYEHSDLITSAAFSRDGSVLAVVSASEAQAQIAFWDVALGQSLSTLTGFETVPLLAFSPDGLQVALGFSGEGITLLELVQP
jgi:WD40 repeat protein